MRKNNFPRANKLSDRSEFVRLFDDPSVYRAKSFQAFWKTNEKSYPRLGITLKGKIPSTVRTKIKRIVREWFRKVKAELGKIDLNIVIKYSDSFSISELEKNLKKWKKPLAE